MDTPITVVAHDGYVLHGRRYDVPHEEHAPALSPRGVVLIAGATGVPQRFYRHFARYAATRGYVSYTLDFRGIGESAPPSLRGFRMDYRDWARLDLAALIGHTAQDSAVAGLPVYYVGHSYGGHALGQLPLDTLTAAAFFGVGAGWAGWMPPAERIKVSFLWNVLAPPLVSWHGYLPWNMLRMGEDLPVDVYRQWRQWCRYPHYFFDDPDIGAEMRTLFARVRIPICAWNATDDLWAQPVSRDAFVRTGYTSASIEVVDVDPTRYQGRVGHIGYFRPSAAALWDETLTWFSSQFRGDTFAMSNT